jgi:hypothetical protein
VLEFLTLYKPVFDEILYNNLKTEKLCCFGLFGFTAHHFSKGHMADDFE